jgi:hypothetical protein
MTEQIRLPEVHKALESFCDEPSVNILALKGPWGAGKSFYLREFFKRRPPPQYRLVSFISFFGARNTDDIFSKILQNALTHKELKEGGAKSRLRRAIGLSAKLPGVNGFTEFFKEVGRDTTKDLLVVFDDIERKHPSLGMKEVLGLVSTLSESLDCKVIVVLNDQVLEGLDKADLDKHREKVFEREILFAPTVSENAAIFFKDQQLFDYAVSVFTECTNSIRVMRQCYDSSVVFRANLGKFETGLQLKARRNVVLLTCLYYSKSDEVSLDRLEDYEMASIFDTDEQKEKLIGTELMRKLSYTSSAFDKIIVGYLRTGRIDEPALEKMREEQTILLEKERIHGEMRRVHSMPSLNFGVNKKDFLENIHAFYSKNFRRCSLVDLQTAEETLAEYGFSGEIPNWREQVIILHAETFNYATCLQLEKTLPDSKAKEAVTKRISSFLNRPPEEIFSDMISKRGWSPEDTASLNSRSEDFYFEWMKNSQHHGLLRLLNYNLETFNPDSTNFEYLQIGKKLIGALKRIWESDKFWRQQIATYVIGPEKLQRWGFPDLE